MALGHLTNDLYGNQGCQGEICHTCPPQHSDVELPDTRLLNTSFVNTPIPTCVTRTITATVRNVGLLSVYSATITETLPTGLSYVANSSEYVTGTGETPPVSGWVSGGEPSGAPDGPLSWTASEIDALARLRPKQTVWVRFQVYADCDFGGGLLTINAGFYINHPSDCPPSHYNIV